MYIGLITPGGIGLIVMSMLAALWVPGTIAALLFSDDIDNKSRR